VLVALAAGSVAGADLERKPINQLARQQLRLLTCGMLKERWLATSLFILAACGGGSSTGGSGGGAAGSGGSVGTGGAAGTGGSAGSGGNAGTAGGTSVTYKGTDGVEHTFAGTALALVDANTLHVYISPSPSAVCGTQSFAHDVAWAQIYVMRDAVNPPPYTTGTYQFPLAISGGSSTHDEGYIWSFAGTQCQQKALVGNDGGGPAGTITITALTATNVEGSFDFSGNEAGTHASGSFKATVCSGSLNSTCAP
jgi:hypothetical protein